MARGTIYSVLDDPVVIDYGAGDLVVPGHAVMRNAESGFITVLPPGVQFISDDGFTVIPPGSVPPEPSPSFFADATVISYTPAVPTDWGDPDPESVQEALDRLAEGGGESGIATKQFWVDKNRTDSYVEDGTILRPYKTIMAAINYIATQDGVGDVIVEPGTYVENVTMNDPALQKVTLRGAGGAGLYNTLISPSSGLALDISGANVWALTQGIQFFGDVQAAGGGFEVDFLDCFFAEDALFSRGDMNVFGCQCNGDLILNGSTFVFWQGAEGIFGGVQLTNGSNLVLSATTVYGIYGLAAVTVDATSGLFLRNAVRIQTPVVTVDGGFMQSYSSWIRELAVINGGFFVNRGSFIQTTTVNTGGTYQQDNTGTMVGVQNGSQAIGSAATSIAVVFPYAFGSAPHVVATLSRPAGGSLIQANVNSDSVTTAGFTAELSATTPNANYKLEWMASL